MRGGGLEVNQVGNSLLARAAAHLGRGLKAAANFRPQRRAKQLTAQPLVELNAGRVGGLALRHAGDRRGY